MARKMRIESALVVHLAMRQKI